MPKCRGPRRRGDEAPGRWEQERSRKEYRIQETEDRMEMEEGTITEAGQRSKFFLIPHTSYLIPTL
jgi:hypothetical protein